jgi:hypothetical protein
VPNLLQLADGTEKVLPTAYIRYQDGMNVVESMRVTSFVGSKMKVVTSIVRASGRYPRKPDSGETPDQAYIVQIAFYGVNIGREAPSPMNKIGVRCSCRSYFFTFSWANMLNGCSFGTRFVPYVRKTPPNDPRYPPKNPGNIPGMCKHQLLVAATLQKSDFYRNKGDGASSGPPSSGPSAPTGGLERAYRNILSTIDKIIARHFSRK